MQVASFVVSVVDKCGPGWVKHAFMKHSEGYSLEWVNFEQPNWGPSVVVTDRSQLGQLGTKSAPLMNTPWDHLCCLLSTGPKPISITWENKKMWPEFANDTLPLNVLLWKYWKRPHKGRLFVRAKWILMPEIHSIKEAFCWQICFQISCLTRSDEWKGIRIDPTL